MSNSKPPIFNHRGQVANSPQEPNPFHVLFLPMYGIVVPAVANAHLNKTPEEIAERALLITQAALARVGFNFNFKDTPDAQ